MTSSTKTIGIIGGVGPETTILYYRDIISGYKEKITDGSFPSVIINSVDLAEVLRLMKDEDALVDFLNLEIVKLQKAGADFGVIASNTPHLIFEKLAAVSPLKLISIVEVACEKAEELGTRKIGLLGTKFTMSGKFYEQVFAKKNIEVISPDLEQQNYIHRIYYDELIPGIVREETRENLLKIIAEMKSRNQIEGIILGGTELSLILQEPQYYNLPVLDTAKLHVARILQEIIGG